MIKPKLIISDVDGTLFDRKDTVTDGLVRLKSLIQTYDIPFTLASGRCYANLSWLAQYLDVKFPVVVNNGTGLMEKDRILWSASIWPENIKEAVRYADKCGMFISFCDAVSERVYRHNAYVQSYIDRFGKQYSYCVDGDGELSDEAWDKLDIQKLLVIDPRKPGRIDEVIKRIHGADEFVSIVKYDDRSMDVMPKGCSKERGVGRLADMLHLDMEDIMVIGDNENDIGMLREAGIGAAVRNATDTLKKYADYVCENDGASGVAEAVETYFLARAGIKSGGNYGEEEKH